MLQCITVIRQLHGGALRDEGDVCSQCSPRHMPTTNLLSVSGCKRPPYHHMLHYSPVHLQRTTTMYSSNVFLHGMHAYDVDTTAVLLAGMQQASCSTQTRKPLQAWNRFTSSAWPPRIWDAIPVGNLRYDRSGQPGALSAVCFLYFVQQFIRAVTHLRPVC